jgi:hypothetical protein
LQCAAALQMLPSPYPEQRGILPQINAIIKPFNGLAIVNDTYVAQFTMPVLIQMAGHLKGK